VDQLGVIMETEAYSPGQQQLPFAFDCRLNQIQQDWQHIAVRFRRTNGIRAGDRGEVFGGCVGKIEVSLELKNGDDWLCCGHKYLSLIWASKAAQDRQWRWVMVPGIGERLWLFRSD
jgi:hypothetical protein